ncbi:MAG TPA: CopG family transcriptional regulator [Elusimicrobia bacterium]|nr:MAG: CopG family transcriptional regulator [Elusimicrobia bacterium GWD2_63_28]HCC46699.1 CopG family transcriptional regulator [Elusimicrobiota bacterium]
MKKTASGDKPVGKLTRVGDFLPPPGALAMPEDTIKVTLSLSRSSVNFFKEQARRNHTKYQRMIRSLVDTYTAHYLHH